MPAFLRCQKFRFCWVQFGFNGLCRLIAGIFFSAVVHATDKDCFAVDCHKKRGFDSTGRKLDTGRFFLYKNRNNAI